jgi:hypothetical protein
VKSHPEDLLNNFLLYHFKQISIWCSGYAGIEFTQAVSVKSCAYTFKKKLREVSSSANH